MSLQFDGVLRFADHRYRGPKLQALSVQFFDAPMRRKTLYLECLGVTRDYIQNTVADRPGRTENEQALPHDDGILFAKT